MRNLRVKAKVQVTIEDKDRSSSESIVLRRDLNAHHSLVQEIIGNADENLIPRALAIPHRRIGAIEGDPVAAFAREHIRPAEDGMIIKADLYGHYVRWSEDLDMDPVSLSAFSHRLPGISAAIPTFTRRTDGTSRTARAFKGIVYIQSGKASEGMGCTTEEPEIDAGLAALFG